MLKERWDLVVAHPPCTYLCNSGVRWLEENPGRQRKMLDACDFFLDCLLANSDKVCVENPIPHKYAREYIGDYTQVIHPWQFGHGESKSTCLWLKGLPPLVPTDVVSGREQVSWRMSPGPWRRYLRSVTYSGLARAMAEQWG
jgi:hypothetical protein